MVDTGAQGGGSTPNAALQKAKANAQMSDQALARVAGVDIKTVQRWLNGEAEAQDRNGRAAATALGVAPHTLWPQRFPAPDPHAGDTLTVSLYSGRAHVPAAVWRDLFRSAEQNIDILVYGGTFLFDAVPGFARRMESAAAAGVKIRLLVGDPSSAIVARRGEEEGIADSLPSRCKLTLQRLAPLKSVDGIAVRTHASTLYASLFRGDDTVIANHHIHGYPASDNPTWILRRDDEPDLWQQYRTSFETVWSSATPA